MDENKKKKKKEEKEGEKKELEVESYDECEKRIEELEDQVKRVLADYQNLEKRTSEDRKNWIMLANKELLLRMLPVLDTLLMAQKHLNDQGLNLSIKQFEDVLKNEGAIRIETLGEEFDSKYMEAVDTVDGEDGKVIEEVQSGYMIGDKLLRPAMVKVGKKVES